MTIKITSYHRKLASGLLIVGGTFLMLEHLFTYDRFDLLDFVGHEYYGLGIITIGFLVSIEWSQWKSMDLKHFKNWFR